MTQKIALLLVHGIGKQDENYAHQISYELKKQFSEHIKKANPRNPAAELVVEPVYWAPVLQKAEDKLWNKLKKGGAMNFTNLRRLMIDFAGDSIAYMKDGDNREIYDAVHCVIAKSIDKLGHHAGQKAPLGIMAHGIGSVMVSNYIWDIQHHSEEHPLVSDNHCKIMDNTPIERGETLCKLYTLGSPLALWSLRHENFGKPIDFPPKKLKELYPDIETEWINYYDKDDIMGYPLKTLSKDYKDAVTYDIEINVGNFLSSWNPASHMGYWNDNDVIMPVARSLAKIWLKINNK